ncbi:MAG: NADH-quinone oxidoreductase subunit L [Rhodopirellula sp.]|nr:NADH-quinone oxidoreductase subunit L [Rhodopirellula sp.]
MELAVSLPLLLGLAWLLPLVSFALIVALGPRMGRGGRGAGFLASGAIIASLVLSLAALALWLTNHPIPPPHHGEHETAAHAAAAPVDEAAEPPLPAPASAAAPLAGDWYTVCEFGSLRLSIGYYIDALTVAMFVMVTLIASCIHVYSFGYMHEELHDVHDAAVLVDGRPLRRRGRFHRFYQYLSLFSFSMLGLVVAGNVFMVFVFWELVGICSYLLIGFYIERPSASRAGNKAFIVNRVGDFGMLIGLMALWGSLGTFAFGDRADAAGQIQPGIFSQVRSQDSHYSLVVPTGMVRFAARDEIETIYRTAANQAAAEAEVAAMLPRWRELGYGHGLLVIAGLGIFCGCVGKSAQFPLHVWLPDAMEGPTPVSALIHAATMVAAGVYLVGRLYPVFTPDVMLVIAYVGCITLFIAATIAITATDIKRVLAYSTVSQLGYMMLALGVGGWLAGLYHLFTHAFFKSLLFLGSGSVIHATGTNEMPEMGGLAKKMPWTAWTMLAGCLAISGAGVPLLIGLSGYYSKDSILAQVFSFKVHHSFHGWIFYAAAAGGAAITAFYMFRLWYMTFAGKPRDEHIFEHAHESPRTMVVPLVILAFFAVTVAWQVPFTNISLSGLLEQARPVGTATGSSGLSMLAVTMPAETESHATEIHVPVSLTAFIAALIGFALATACYGLRTLDPAEASREFPHVYRFLRNKWWFDELYQRLFIGPTLRIADWIADLDKRGIDRAIDGLARAARMVSGLDDWIDRWLVDGLVNRLAAWFYDAGLWLRRFQTGNLRQYVMFIVVGTVGLFVLVSLYWNYTVAG